jgi:D-xylose 1-dehydrogenase (NADP+, D-xylono-1,5-lactone-forming)
VNPVHWGLLSTASIGRLVVAATRGSGAARFVAVASRDGDRARQFAADLDLERAFASYEALLECDGVDAVYIALPNSMHSEWTIKAVTAGKHVLCEKPFALSPEAARQAFDAAAGARLVCAEGFMYRYHPQTALVRKLIEQGAIGALQHLRSALSVIVPAGDIRRNRALGGGAYLDLGSYCMSAARLFGGNPERLYAEVVRDAGGVDTRLAATMRLEHDVLAQFDVGLDLPRRDELELIGTEGKIVVSDPWLCRARTVELYRDGRREQLAVDPEGTYRLAHDDLDVYRIELDTVSAAITVGAALPFGAADAIDQARALQQLMASSQGGRARGDGRRR